MQGLLKNKAKKTQLFPTSFAQLGKPIANTQFLVLDSHLNLVPSGFPGELYIGGSGLARGYLHRGDLTAARFIPNPTPLIKRIPPQSPLDKEGWGDRLYQTGDRVQKLIESWQKTEVNYP